MSEISYPIDAMHETAQKIRTNASNSLGNHEMHWHQVQISISPLPGFMRAALNLVLEPYDKRLRQSFQSHMDFADWLDQAATTMNGLDQDISQSLQ